jgi:hypothetical protein
VCNHNRPTTGTPEATATVAQCIVCWACCSTDSNHGTAAIADCLQAHTETVLLRLQDKAAAILDPRKPWLRCLEEALALRHYLKKHTNRECSLELIWQWAAGLGLHPELERDLLSRLSKCRPYLREPTYMRVLQNLHVLAGRLLGFRLQERRVAW